MIRCLRNAVVIFLVTQTVIFSQTVTPNSELYQRLQTALDSLQSVEGYTGLSAAVEFADGTCWQGTAGTANTSANTAVEPDMLFSAASITKTFTASLILQLMDQGLLGLDDTLSDWLPDYDNIDNSITIRQMLNHSSGLYEYSDNLNGQLAVLMHPDQYWSPEEILSLVLEPYFEPGTDYHYSNTNYILLGMIACKALQVDSLENEYTSRFFNTCGLPRTFLDVEQDIPDTCVIANGYMDLNNDGVLDDLGAFPRTAIYSAAWTAGAIVSTSRDLAHWGQCLYRGEILSPVLLDTMLNSRPIDAQSGLAENYGLGVMLYTFNSHTFYGHTGHIPGYASQLVYSPEMDFSVCILNNDHFANLSPVTRTLTGLLIDQATDIAEPKELIASGFDLAGCYPNPFNSRTVVRYNVDHNSQIAVRIFDVSGRQVVTLTEGYHTAGEYEQIWDGRDDSGSPVSSGIYFCQLHSKAGTQTLKLTLIK